MTALGPVRATGGRTGPRPRRARGGPLSYENRLLLLLGLTQGCMFFDRLVLNFLSPEVMASLALNNAQIVLLATAMCIAWATAGYLGGALADRTGRRKQILVIATVAFSLSSLLSGFAVSFATLLIARVVMGLVEGPILPISQTLMSRASSPARRGLNMGLLQNFSVFLIGQFLGALIATQLSSVAGWRATFFMAAAPGLGLAWLIWRHVDEVPAEAGAPAAEAARIPAAPPAGGMRNVRLCMAIAACFGSWMILQVTFLPVYLTRVSGLSLRQMGVVMSAMGLSGIAAAVLVPGLSDRFGRKRVLTAAMAGGIITPLGILLLANDVTTLSLVLLLGSFATGAFPLYIAVIPAESLPLGKIAGAIGLVSACAELMGSAILPAVVGIAADRFGLVVMIWTILAMALLAVLLSLFLVETAPRRRGAAAFAPAFDPQPQDLPA